MKILRWLLFLPVAAIAAVATGFAVASLFPERCFHPDHVMLSIVHPRGLAGFILARFAATAVFVLLGSLLAPGSGRKVVVVLALVACVYSMPLPTWPGGDVPQFFGASIAGALIGCAVGMLLAFHLRHRRSSSHSSNALDCTLFTDVISAQQGPVIQKSRLARSAGVADLSRSTRDAAAGMQTPANMEGKADQAKKE